MAPKPKPPVKPAAKRAPSRKPAAQRAVPATTGGARHADLDAARSARAESNGEEVTVKFGGVIFTLPPELPADFALNAADGRMRDAIEALFGDNTAAFMALRPSMQDIEALTEHMSAIYGIAPGE